MSRLNRFLFFLFLLILLGNGIAIERVRRQNVFLLDCIDIGQGDSSLLQYLGKNILIDGGDRPADRARTKRDLGYFLASQGVKKIDLMILTHPHADHLGGLAEIMKTFPVAMVLQSPGEHATALYRHFKELAKRKKIPLVTALEGMRISVGTEGKMLRMEILSPPENAKEANLDSLSVVIGVSYGKHRILFTGDIRAPREKWLVVHKKEKLAADVLKIAHHGSETSSSILFLKTVQPKVAVISCGENNKYGFPREEALQRIKKYSRLIHRTDREGTLKIVFFPDRFCLIPHYTKKWWRLE